MNRISPYPKVQGGRGTRGSHSDEPGVSGECLEMNVAARFPKDEDVLKVTFLEDENVDGITLVQQSNYVRELQIRLGDFNRGPRNRFPGNTAILLNKTTMSKLKQAGPVVMAPKPLGIRYLLYVDPIGKMYMENETQHIFIVDQDRAPKPIPKDTVLDGIVVRKIVRDGAAQNNNEVAYGKLTFVIMDATRINGVDLTEKNIQERISVAQAEIMLKRTATNQVHDEEHLGGPRLKRRRTSSEVFGLDITTYVEGRSHMEGYLSQGFKDSYQYPIRSFVINPRVGGYTCGGLGKRIYQWNEIADVECAFRLKVVTEERPSEVELYTHGPYDEEILFKSSIEWSDELEMMDKPIIDCRYLNDRWTFVRVNTVRQQPNCLHWINGKLQTLKRSVPLKELISSLK